MSDLVSESVRDATTVGPHSSPEGVSGTLDSSVDSAKSSEAVSQSSWENPTDSECVKSEDNSLHSREDVAAADSSDGKDTCELSSHGVFGTCSKASNSDQLTSEDTSVSDPEKIAEDCRDTSKSSENTATTLQATVENEGNAGQSPVVQSSTVSNNFPNAVAEVVEKTEAKDTDETGANNEISQATAATELPGATGNGTDSQNVYHVKWIKFRGSQTPIVMQNQNGPCPLLAVVNVLLLQGKIKLSTGTDLVASDQLMAYIADWIFDNVPKHITEGTRLNYEQNMHDAIAVFPRLQTGLDVNVKFTGISHFEYTPECVVFDLLDIPLVHGWLVDPNLKSAAEAVGTFSYNQLVERIIENKNSSDAALVTEALVAEEFLNASAAQLTYHGLCELSATLKEEQLCVLFRNNHFSTLYKHKTELFVLATDQGFLSEPNVVWETLSNVEGDGHFVDAMFHTYRLPELPTQRPTPAAAAVPAPPANSKEQIDHDFLVALSLEQEQGEAGGNETWLGSETAGLSDHDLALKLQEEEDLNAGVTTSTPSQSSLRPPKATSSTASVSKPEKKSDKENCIIL